MRHAGWLFLSVLTILTGCGGGSGSGGGQPFRTAGADGENQNPDLYWSDGTDDPGDPGDPSNPTPKKSVFVVSPSKKSLTIDCGETISSKVLFTCSRSSCSWTIGPELPEGLTVKTESTRVILSGSIKEEVSYTGTVEACDVTTPTACAKATLAIAGKAAGALTFQTKLLYAATVGKKASAKIALKGGSGEKENYELKAQGALPPGLALNATAFTIEGTPTKVGKYAINLIATDLVTEQTASKTYELVVNEDFSVSAAIQGETDTLPENSDWVVPYGKKLKLTIRGSGDEDDYPISLTAGVKATSAGKGVPIVGSESYSYEISPAKAPASLQDDVVIDALEISVKNSVGMTKKVKAASVTFEGEPPPVAQKDPLEEAPISGVKLTVKVAKAENPSNNVKMKLSLCPDDQVTNQCKKFYLKKDTQYAWDEFNQVFTVGLKEFVYDKQFVPIASASIAGLTVADIKSFELKLENTGDQAVATAIDISAVKLTVWPQGYGAVDIYNNPAADAHFRLADGTEETSSKLFSRENDTAFFMWLDLNNNYSGVPFLVVFEEPLYSVFDVEDYSYPYPGDMLDAREWAWVEEKSVNGKTAYDLNPDGELLAHAFTVKAIKNDKMAIACTMSEVPADYEKGISFAMPNNSGITVSLFELYIFEPGKTKDGKADAKKMSLFNPTKTQNAALGSSYVPLNKTPKKPTSVKLKLEDLWQ